MTPMKVRSRCIKSLRVAEIVRYSYRMSSPSAQTTTSTTVVLVFGSDDKLVKEVGEGLKAKLNVKGGGKGPRWSGKFTSVWKDAREGAVVESLLGGL